MTAKRPQILITIGRLDIGGAEMRLLALAERLWQRRVALDLRVFVVSGLGGVLDHRFEQQGVQIVRGAPGLAGLRALFRELRARPADVLHVNADAAAGFYGFIGLLAAVPCRIAHLRSTRTDQKIPDRLKACVYEVCTSLFCNRIVGVGTSVFERRWIWRKPQPLYNGLARDSTVRNADSASSLRVLVLSRMTRKKNIEFAFQVFATLVRLKPEAVMDLVGPFDDLDGEALREMARNTSAPGRIRVHGPTADPMSFFRASDVFLMPSLHEGLPGTVLESLACGTPAVAANIPGNREIKQFIPALRLCNTGDEPDQWAQAIIESQQLSRNELIAQFARSPFDLDRHTDQMLTLWSVPKEPVR